MKRYEVAKREGLPWEAVLVTDAETDLKILIRDCVRRGESLASINDKVTKFIREVVSNLENERIKQMVRSSFPMFATRLYNKWLLLIGTQAAGLAYLSALKRQKMPVPKSFEESIKALPKARGIDGYSNPVGVNAFSMDSDSPTSEADIYINFNAYNRATPNNMYNLDYEREIQRRLNDIADMSAKTDYNARYSLRAGVELEYRAERNKKQIRDLRENGTELAWIDTHANCSDRCQHWQGKLYSLTGKSGTIDGVEYQPLENATEIIDEYGYKNGCLSGFNCRHKLIPYKQGFRPIPIPQEVMDRQRDLERQQRYMERTIRRYEARALMAKGENQKKAYKHFKTKATEWTRRYESFSRKNKIPFYPSRLDI